MEPQQLAAELQQATSDDMRRRREIIALSVLGMASMSMVTLFRPG